MRQTPGRRVTAADVARAAGVSRATVSYVLNDTPHQKITAETRERVHDAARALGYTPSSVARTLAKGRSDTVLLVLPDWPLGSSLTAVIEHLADELEAAGLSLVTRRQRPHQRLRAFWRDLMPAAVIALDEIPADEQEPMLAAGVHVTDALLAAASREPRPHLTAQAQMGSLQVQHLARAGHRRLAYAAPRDTRVHLFRDLRLAGVREACRSLGLDPPLVTEIEMETGAAATAADAWRLAGVTAVCAYNDDHAFAVLAGMRTLGLSAPDDLAVIGIDNVPLAPFACPPLTTVDQHEEVTATQLARVVVAGLRGEDPPRLPGAELCTLVVRESA